MKKLLADLPDFPLGECRDLPPDKADALFHDVDPKLAAPGADALAFCSPCFHQGDCLKWALDHKESGVWGGTTDFQRAALLRPRHRVHCPGCSSVEIITDYGENTEICLDCGLSWYA